MFGLFNALSTSETVLGLSKVGWFASFLSKSFSASGLSFIFGDECPCGNSGNMI